MQKNGVIAAQSALNPKYLITGYYNFNSAAQKLTVVPQDVVCLGCSRRERLETKLFADVPPATIYNVVTFGADYVDLQNSASGEGFHLYRVPTFSLGYSAPAKEFTVEVTLPNNISVDNTVYAELVPADGIGKMYSAFDTVSDASTSVFDFSIPITQFSDSVKDYILLMVVVPSQDDLTLRSDGTIINIQNVVAENTKNAILLHIDRDHIETAPLQAVFTPSN